MALPKASRPPAEASSSAPPPHQRRCAGDSAPLSRCAELEPSEADIIGALRRALESIIESTRAHAGGLTLRGASSGELIFALVRGDDSANGLLWQRPPAARGHARRPESRAREIDGDGAGGHEGVPSVVDIVAGLRNRFRIASPLLDGNELLGSVELFKRKNRNRFTPGDHNNLTALAHLLPPILIALRNHQAEKFS